MRVSSIIVGFTSLIALVIDTVVWINFFQRNNSPQFAILTHVVMSASLVLVIALCMGPARLSTKVTLLIFLFLFACLLPVVGILSVALFAWIMRTAAGDGSSPEDLLVVGNHQATAARRESREKSPLLLPFCEELRNKDFDGIEQMIHGLKFMGPPRKTLPMLRRFQNDARSNLQFAAQGVIYTEFETREIQIKELHARIRENSHAVEPRLALAEVLLSLAEWTPPGDSTAKVYQEEALKHVQEAGQDAPLNARRLLLEIRALIALQQPEAALTALDNARRHLHDQESVKILRMQALHLKRDYLSVAKLACQIREPSSELAEVLHFWSRPNPANF
jgi:hypothetical protein